MIGRLQTERDKARMLEALSSVSGEVDLAVIEFRARAPAWIRTP